MKSHLDNCVQLQNEGFFFKSLESTNNTNSKIKSSELISNNKEKKHVYKKYVPMKISGKFSYNGKKTSNIDYNLPFQKKLEILRKKLSTIKIDWREGCCQLELSRDNFLNESIKQFQKINIFKVI